MVFVAQELEEIFPELVSTQMMPCNQQKKMQIRIIEQGSLMKLKKHLKLIEYKGVNYIGMIPILVEAIQEQQAQIEKQQAEIEELKKLVGNQ